MAVAAGERSTAGEDRIEEIAEGLDQLFDLMVSLHEQEKTRDKMFDA